MRFLSHGLLIYTEIFTGSNQWKSNPETEAFAIAQNGSQINLLGVHEVVD
jgi:hypothetical protein